jgi:tetratricopeptide (TPR) repeat protein
MLFLQNIFTQRLGDFISGKIELTRSIFTMDQTLFMQGLQAFQKGDHENAIAALEQIVAENPNHEESWRMLGLSRLAVGDTRGAVKAQENAVRIDPSEAQNFTNLGRAFEANNQSEQARENYEKALRMDMLQTAASEGLKRLPTTSYVPGNPNYVSPFADPVALSKTPEKIHDNKALIRAIAISLVVCAVGSFVWLQVIIASGAMFFNILAAMIIGALIGLVMLFFAREEDGADYIAGAIALLGISLVLFIVLPARVQAASESRTALRAARGAFYWDILAIIGGVGTAYVIARGGNSGDDV